MATEIMATGATAANSTDLTVTTPITVGLKDAAGPWVTGASVKIQLKADNGEYFNVGELFGAGDRAATLIVAPGTYRFSRPAGVACGVFSA